MTWWPQMLAAGLASSADPITLKSSLRIAESTDLPPLVCGEDAPVSNLYLFGRKEDLAFEKPVGDDARRAAPCALLEVPQVGCAGPALLV